jgi:hypothetical protein
MNIIFQYLKYDQYFIISACVLLFTFIIYFLKIDEKRKINFYYYLFLIAIFSNFIFSIFLGYNLYLLWKDHPLSKYLVQNKDYFFGYIYFHFFRDLIFRLIGILIVIFLMIFLNFVFKRDIFYDEEKILIPFLSLLFHFPYNALFIVLGFVFLFLGILIFNLSKSERFSFKNYWIFLALILFLLQPLFLSNYEFLKYTP